MNQPYVPLSILLLDVDAATRQHMTAALQAQTRFLLVPDSPQSPDTPDTNTSNFELTRPDIVLLGMPGDDPHGLRTARRIRALIQQAPQTRKVQVVVLTELGREEDIFRGLKAGARGYLLREASAAQVIECLRTVARGSRYVSPFVVGKLVARLRHDALSEGELEILQMMAEGKSADEIARRTLLSQSSLDIRISSIMFKISAVPWNGSHRSMRRSLASVH